MPVKQVRLGELVSGAPEVGGGAGEERGDGMDRLFVPLMSEPWEWFRSGEKSVEVRGVGPRFSVSKCRVGRGVELRKGYSGPSLWGWVEEVAEFGEAGEIFEWFAPVDEVVPPASSVPEAVEVVEGLLGEREGFVAFRVGGVKELEREG